MVAIEKLTSKYDVLELQGHDRRPCEIYQFRKGQGDPGSISSEYLPKFKKIIPHDYKKMQMAIVQMEEKGPEQRTGPDRGILCQHQ